MLMEIDWDLFAEVASASGTDRMSTSRVISLIDAGNTLPFIARYRKEATGNMEPESIRRIKSKLASCREVIDRIEKAFKLLHAKGALSTETQKSLRQCKTVEDVSLIADPFKDSAPVTLAAKARAQGLEPIAMDVLKTGRTINFSSAAHYYKVQLTAEDEIRQGVSNIIADIIAKDISVLRLAEELCERTPPLLETSPRPVPKTQESPKALRAKAKAERQDFQEDIKKFAMYLNFSMLLSRIAPHKILAINRAEERKVIKVNLIFSESVQVGVRDLISSRYIAGINGSHHSFVWSAFNDAWKRLIIPYLKRKLRSKVTAAAHDLSLGVFSDNLKHLLMTAPLRVAMPLTAGAKNAGALSPRSVADVVSASLGDPGDRVPVVGLDPGWRHGCKWAACDPLGSVLQAGVIHIGSQNTGARQLINTMVAHGINTIALGNGQACRQTERWLAQCVANGDFGDLRVRYTIVSESGASVYSASKLADHELPNVDVSLRGAVSIARRLQDPLAELVKVEPKHLGVGMYQHDLPPKRLEDEVNQLMEECISFVGVDVNTAQQHILARVAGLSDAKARSIIDYRSTRGRIHSRNELLRVKGIGQASFSQCAGFLRVRPNYSRLQMNASKDVEFISLCSDEDDIEMKVVSRKRRQHLISSYTTAQTATKRMCLDPKPDPKDISFHPLDQTAIHPDAYGLATTLVKYLLYEISDVGCPGLRKAAQVLLDSPNRDSTLAQFESSEFGLETARDIIKVLSQPLDFDERQNQFTPMFRSSVMSFANLSIGLQVTGHVQNVTTFGAFIDIGVEETAFAPLSAFPASDKRVYSHKPVNSQLAPGKTTITKFSLHLGDRVKAFIDQFSSSQKKISLRNVELL